ncbi:MAG: sugar transferase [Bacteroidia bacterium]|nr:sugar transferase [Bacteroidia bacterium]MDW8302642.1 sugar transferase [Bacteroidia bacterium]
MKRFKQYVTFLIFFISDFSASFLGWILFYYLRRHYIEAKEFGVSFQIILPAIVVSTCWCILYAYTGLYKTLFRKSRLTETIKVAKITLIGVGIIFFAVLLDDPVDTTTRFRFTYFAYFIVQFSLVATFRLIVNSIAKYLVITKKVQFNTILVGSGEQALNLYLELEKNPNDLGQRFIGFIADSDYIHPELQNRLPYLGKIEDVEDVVKKYDVQDIIVATEHTHAKDLLNIINKLRSMRISIKLNPDRYDIIAGYVKTTQLLGTPLVEIQQSLIPSWEKNSKRLVDIIVSLFVLVFFSWLYIILIIAVKLNSKGPAFYTQERIGKDGVPFRIIKFRSMYVDAEKFGPALSKENDPRVTKVGRFLRKYRLDEIPQFWNVLIGQMSLVGPRPERKHFIEQIVQKAPEYYLLHQVRPGITSWGQVKFGYAENVDQMLQRMKYDLLYIENMSLTMDLKIILYTIKTILKAEGK